MQETYLKVTTVKHLPRIPLRGNIDLTYRCNNNCRHCWLHLPSETSEKNKELTFEEIKSIVEESKNMGCRRWLISGGEPMLRTDFAEIFDYLTKNSASYSINTNGTLITPEIAKLLKRRGTKMVALYGATAKVHDSITRNPGSFEATMRGFRYLKEAVAGFMVQLIPMRDNYRQFPEMVKLAESLSKDYRIGASWLHLSACGNRRINQEIKRQRLGPKDVIELDNPDLSYKEWLKEDLGDDYCDVVEGEYFFSLCVAHGRSFHIDPYGKMTFCCYLKDPQLRYDLRNGKFRQGWEEFIPSLAREIKTTKEYKDNCGSCSLRKDCRCCPVHGYLECGRFGAKVNYLCEVAKENKTSRENWQQSHRRYFRIGGITIQFESDLPIKENTFHSKFKHFQVQGPSEDMIQIRHHFFLPDLEGRELGEEVYRKAPWAIYRKDASWIYLGISPTKRDHLPHRVAVFSSNHLRGRIYNDNIREKIFLKGGLHSLTLFSSDQILLARVLADRQGLYLHSCGVNFKGKGLLFTGNSGAGKSTMATTLKKKAQILCDDRIIIRKSQTDFRIYGTWSHGEVPEVSAASVPLRAILFLKKSKENRVTPLKDRREIIKRLLSCVIRPLVTVDWWEKTLSLVEDIGSTVPCYELSCDKSGKVVDLLSSWAFLK